MYSNPRNTPEQRIEFLEETIDSIIKILKYQGADFSDINQHPIEQIIGREFSILKNKK